MPGHTPHNPDDVTSAVPSPSPHADVTAPTAAIHTPIGAHAHPAPPASATVPVSTAPGYATVFNPGETLLGRYRIVARLGKGGMGEVYRADDLALGAAVALKFLPPHYAADPVWAERFRAEVRLTRQISHPNVCRVYDIAELPASSPAAAPRLFLAMEYIDGEDLASLLRRIGRLPQDKAVQIARQICFGLAAAHEQGVIHRDLKPANVMLDGRGNARITDFGVAGLLEQFVPGSADVVVGTPAYMAPEQLAGRSGSDVAKRSDIYALGLVLYELFTGKRAHAAATLDELRSRTLTGTRPTRPTEHIADLDPAVERAILRCLEFDPAQRPSSALAVAAALPGGDPLAAALAAGETPSPELVARSGEVGSISARAAALSLVAILALLLGALALNAKVSSIAAMPAPSPPAALTSEARKLATALGVTDAPADEASGFNHEPAAAEWIRALPDDRELAAQTAGNPPTVAFWYRHSPSPLRPLMWARRGVTLADPPARDPGQTILVLDPAGRLLRFVRVPYDSGFGPAVRDTTTNPAPPSAAPPAPPPALAVALKAAGFDPAALTPVEPLRAPSVGADRRYAFVGAYPAPESLGPIPARIEAAALGDQLVTFSVMGPWDTLHGKPTDPDLLNTVVEIIAAILITAAVVGAVLLARINLRKRRSDTRGAIALGSVIFTTELLALAIPRDTLADILSFEVIGRPMARAAWTGVLVTLMYIALEPIVRKRNPATVIAWARLVTGDWRNPRIGRDLLMGIGLGALYCVLLLAALNVSSAFTPNFVLRRADLFPLSGTLFTASTMLAVVSGAVAIALAITLLLVGVEALVRSRAIAYPLVTAATWLMLFSAAAETPLGVVAGVLGAIALMLTLARVGILGAVAFLYTITVVSNTPAVLSLSAWTAAPALTVTAVVAALAAWAAYRASLGFQAGTAAPAQPA